MNKLLLLAFLCISFVANSQNEIWSRKVSEGTFMSQLDDGKIFLKDKTKVSLINNLSGKTEWENNIATEDDPQFLDDLPLMYFEGGPYAVIDATSGYLIDESKVKTEVLRISYFWNEGRIIVELGRDKNLHVLNIDLNDLSKSWNTMIGPVNKSFFGQIYQENGNQPIITNDGSLVLVDKKYISIVGAKGTMTKRIKSQKNLKVFGFNKEKNILYTLEDKKKLHFFDIKKGITNATFEFGTANLKLDILGDGSTISVVQNNELRILDGVLGIQVASHGSKYKINQTYIDEESGKFYILSKYILSEIDHKTGKVIREAFYEMFLNDIYKVYDKTIVSGNKGASPINLATLKLKYNKIPNIPSVHDYVESEDYVIYTNQSGDNYSLNVVDKIGNVLWGKSYYSAVSPSLDVIGGGLLIINGRKVRYLDIRNGEPLWKSEVEVDASFTYGIDEKTSDLFMYSQKRLYRFNYSDGTLSKSKDKFKFDDFDYTLQQPQLMVLPDAIFLKGSNTIFVVSKDGSLIHEKTYERISNVSKFLKWVDAVAAVVTIAGSVGEIINVYSGDGIINQGGMINVLNDNWDYAEGLKDERRAKQNRSSNAYPYVFTKLENGKRALIFINPSTGKERFFVVLDEKNPSYFVDNIDGVMFHLSKTSLKAYDIK